jgi:hypothetical protein
MPEPNRDAPSLQTLALRYAAGDLPPAEAAAFEARLGNDQPARDALAEAVRLSAAALGQDPPAPDRTFRALIRERLRPPAPWWCGWLARRAYRGHPLVWFGTGVTAAAALTCATLTLEPLPPPHAGPDRAANVPPAGSGPRPAAAHPPATPGPVAASTAEPAGDYGPDDGMRRAAELWAELSTPDRVEKARDDEVRMRQMLRDPNPTSPTRPPPVGIEVRDP